MVQWLRLHTPSAEGMGLIPGQKTKILHDTQHSLKKKKKNPSKLSLKKKIPNKKELYNVSDVKRPTCA